MASLKPTYAAVDVGSNNVRMDMYGVDAEGRLVKIGIPEQTVFACKLAEGMSGKKPIIKRENLALAVTAMSAFDALLTAYNIKPGNTCTIMTEALRAVKKSKQGKQDIAQLVAAFHNRHFTIITGKEEAILVGEAVKIACPIGWDHHQGKKRSMAFASIGGGSIELGKITAKGNIRNAVALPYGIHPLRQKSNNGIKTAGKILKRGLRERKCLQSSQDVLAVIGGNWRALGESLHGGSLPAMLKNKWSIHPTLIGATLHSTEYYESLGGRPKKRAEFMPLSAEVLRRVAKHFDAKRVLFLETTVRDAMAHQLLGLHTGVLTRPPRGLKRLFCPSNP